MNEFLLAGSRIVEVDVITGGCAVYDSEKNVDCFERLRP